MNDPATQKLFEPICFHNQQLDKFTWGFEVFRLSAVLKAFPSP